MTGLLSPGEPAPWFKARALDGNDRYVFDSIAGRWTLLLFVGSATGAAAQAALRLLADHRDLFDDARASFFGVTIDPSDAAQGRIAQSLPGVRWFLDYDRAVSRRYGAVDEADDGGEGVEYASHWLLLDPMLRGYSRAPLADGAKVLAGLRAALAAPAGKPSPAPVLVVPRIFPPALCRRLIALYEENGGTESGFMREENGVTVMRFDPAHKRRADCNIADPELIAELKARISATLKPMIQRAFQFEMTRIERFIVACYDASDGGHFRAHRDNTTKGTAHRKFACTINLNAEDYEGGDLAFPEFGAKTYRAPTGGAVVFSCSLLHEVRPLRTGRRYAFLPFVYDDDGARLREQNLAHVSEDLSGYRPGTEA